MSYDPYGGQEYKEPESCLPQIHRWRPIEADEPLPPWKLAGRRCYCGLRVLVLHQCECGDEHLRHVQVGSVKIEGRPSGQATDHSA